MAVEVIQTTAWRKSGLIVAPMFADRRAFSHRRPPASALGWTECFGASTTIVPGPA